MARTLRAKKNRRRLLGALFAAFLISFLIICKSQAPEARNPMAVETWKIGSSSGVLEEFTVEEFTRIRQFGIQFAELSLNNPLFYSTGGEREEYCREIAGAAEEAGVRIWSVHLPYGKEWDISTLEWNRRQIIVEKFRRLFEILEILKPEKAIIHPSFEPVPQEERELRIRASREALQSLEKAARHYRVQLTVENLPRTCLGNSSGEILELIKGIKGIGVCCDVNHLTLETPSEFIRQVRSQMVSVHISDFDGEDEKHWLPGEGIIDWNSVIEAMVESGYRGPFLFECRGSAEDLIKTWNRLKSDYLAGKGNILP